MLIPDLICASVVVDHVDEGEDRSAVGNLDDFSAQSDNNSEEGDVNESSYIPTYSPITDNNSSILFQFRPFTYDFLAIITC